MKKVIKNIFYIVLEISMILCIIYIFKYCYDMYSINRQSNLLNDISINDASFENVAKVNSENNENSHNSENAVEEVKTERRKTAKGKF